MKLDTISPVGHRCFGFTMSRSLVSVDFPETDSIALPSFESEQSDPNQSLFDIVFGVDPRTNLPVGDVQMYLGENTNPDIKRFIELNLHSPVTPEGAASGDFSSLSDDDILSMTRGRDESVSSYRDRMIAYLKPSTDE